MCFLNVLGVKHAVDDGLKMTGLDALNDASELFVHHGFVGPGAHVNTEHRTVSRHQPEGIELWSSTQGEECLEQGTLPGRRGC